MDKAAAARIVGVTGWLSRQPEAFRAEVTRRSHLRRFEAGEALYHAGDPPGGVFGLAEGALTITLPSGQVASVKRAGFWIGETSAMRRENRLVTVAASIRSHALYLPLAEFERMVADAVYCRLFATMSMEHLDEALAIIGHLMVADTTARVAGRILTLAEVQGVPDGEAMQVTQGDLAQMCGVSRQTVNRVLATLAERRVVTARYGAITILNRARLRLLTGELTLTDAPKAAAG